MKPSNYEKQQQQQQQETTPDTKTRVENCYPKSQTIACVALNTASNSMTYCSVGKRF